MWPKNLQAGHLPPASAGIRRVADSRHPTKPKSNQTEQTVPAHGRASPISGWVRVCAGEGAPQTAGARLFSTQTKPGHPRRRHPAPKPKPGSAGQAKSTSRFGSTGGSQPLPNSDQTLRVTRIWVDAVIES